jgi:hypothetical protein
MTVLRPGDIYTGSFDTTGADTVLSAAPVGSSGQWSDDSDATYCDIVAQNAGTPTGVSTTLADADFPPMGGSVASLIVRCRLELLVTNVDGEQKFGILFPTSEGNASSDRQNINHGLYVTDGLPVGVPTWVDFDVSEDPIAARLGDGLTIMFGTRFAPVGTTTPVAMYRVYEVELIVATTGGLAPPCHIYPRDDDQGVGTAAIWPPPSSQQATGQPGGYY